MSIIDHTNKDWDLSEKGKKDAERHRNKVEDQIKKRAIDVIAEENIITSKKGKKVRVPIRGLKDYRFKYGEKNDGIGVGQGKGKPGDIIGREDKKGKPGEPGNEPGEDVLEVEVDIDYLIKIIFEDLGLPYIEEKMSAKQAIPKGWKFDAIVKKGIFSQVNKKKTIFESIKRNMAYAAEIMRETGCDEEDAYKSLIQSNFILEKAIEIVLSNSIDKSIDTDQLFIEDDDIRFNKVEDDIEYKSKCVILAAIDSSGSMTTNKKFLCRTFLFWVTKFLEKCYDNVEIRFITHTTTARLVNEDEFFRTGECHTKDHYILMEDRGLKRISEVDIGDTVMSVNNETLKLEPKKVIKKFNKEVSETLEISLIRGSTLQCTPNHKYFVFDKNLNKIVEKEAFLLNSETDLLIIPDVSEYYNLIMEENIISESKQIEFKPKASLIKIGKITKKIENVNVYDITVEDNSSYIIDGVYSHNSGGTYCHSAFDLMNDLLSTEYPKDEWNSYIFYCGDGEDFDFTKTLTSIDTIIKKDINMFSYLEVLPQEESYGYQYETLLSRIKREYSFVSKKPPKNEVKNSEGSEFFKNEEKRILLCKIGKKEHIVPALKYFLFDKRIV